jgi:hypothetical protein
MQDDVQDTDAETGREAEGAGTGTAVRARPARGPMWWVGWFMGIVGLAALVVATGLWVRLAVGPVSLPGALQERVVARLDAGMPNSRLRVGDMVIDLPDGGRAPLIELRDVRLADPDGAPRAAFPALRIHIDPAPILSGVLRPRRVEIAGAALRLSRDEAGRFDLDLSGAAAPADVTLPQTMARLDAMFAAPVFDGLEEVTATGLRLSLDDAMTRQVLRIDDAGARLTRRAGQLTLTVGGDLTGSRSTRLDIAVLRRAVEAETEIALVFRDLAARELATVSPALGWLDLLRAPISGRLAVALADDGTVGDLQARLDIGAGRVSLGQGGAPLGFERLAADLSFDPRTQRLTFGALRLDAPALRFAGHGHADLVDDGTAFVAQLRLADLGISPQGAFPEPLEIDGADMDLRLTLRPALRIELGGATLFDGEYRLHLSGAAEPAAGGLRISLDGDVPEVGVEDLLGYWPENAAPGTRRWVAANVEAGRVRGIDLALRAVPGEPLARAMQMNLEDVTVRPLRTGPPIRGAGGYLELIGPRFVVHLDAGRLAAPGGGAVDMAGTTMVVEEVGPRGPEAAISVHGAGALSDVLAVLDGPPFDIFRDGTLTPERIGAGKVTLRADLATRLMRREGPASMSELGLTASAELRDFSADALVPGRRITANRLEVALTPRAIRVSGPAALDGLALTGTWERPLGPDAPKESVLTARADIDPAGLEGLGVDLPDWLLSGRGALDLRLDFVDGAPPRLAVESDLAGLSLAIPALGWRSGAAETGRFAAEIGLGEAPQVRRLALAASGLEAEGAAALRPGGGLADLRLDRLQLGTWLDVSGALTSRGEGVPPAIEVTGGRVSLADAPNITGDGGGATAPVPLDLRLDRLELSEQLALTDMRGVFETGAALEGEFEARVNGEAPVTGLLSRGRHGPELRLLASDGGAVLRAAGVFQTAYGGRMALFLGARPEPRRYDGVLRIEGPRLRDAPAMAELLNLISVVGLLEQLSGEGINLGTVEARFVLQPGRLTVTEGTAVGPSLGVSMSGSYDTVARRFDMEGVVSPLYMINGLAGALFAPRGEGLFGFSYRLTGTPGQSNVTVNPLSILTPGIFREIFRRPPPDPAAAPPQAPTQ